MSALRVLRSATAGVVVALAGMAGGACSLIGTSGGSHLESVFKLQVG